jgi:hypothetical protein
VNRVKMLIVGSVLAAGLVAGVSVAVHSQRTARAAISVGGRPARSVPVFVAGSARSAARLTKDQALGVVRQEFGSDLLTHPAVVGYGSFTDNNLVPVRGSGTAVGRIDAWQILVTGLNLPRPCMQGATQCPPPVTTLSIVVDDKAGRFLEAIGS